MRLVRRLSLRFRLNLALGCLTAIGLGATGLHAWRAHASQQAAEAAFDANATAELLLQAAGTWAMERGLVNTALRAPLPASSETLAAIGARRAAADQAAAAAAVASVDLPAAVTALATSRQALAALRTQVDAALAQPLPERASGLAPRWFAGITAVIEASQRLRHDAAFHAGGPAAQLAALQQLKQAVWVVSEYAGRERAVLGGVIAAKVAISPAQLLELGGYRGRVELAWVDIQSFAASADAPATVRDAIGTVGEAFFGQYQAVRMQVYAAGMGDAGYPIERQAWVGRATQAIDTVLALSRAAGDAAALLAAGSTEFERKVVWGTMAVFGLELLIVMASLLVVTVQVVRPLARLSRATRQLAAGELQAPIPCQGWTDELGDLAASVVVLRDGMVEKLRLEQEAAAARIQQAAEDERSRREAGQAAATTEFVVGSVGGALERLAAGDLSFRLAAVLPGNYDTLRADLNAATDRLQDAMQGIAGSVQAVRSGTGEIAQASDDLSRRTENQAASLEQTAAALDQVTATVRKTADGAKQARAIVADTQKEAAHSGEVVRQAVLAMGKIERSSSEIGEIIGVIDEIAFQTNLLALNAGVEAARAGDAGRGFAVVASEVRALALRSAGAAKEIKALVHASSQQVGAGVKLVGETGQALVRIVAQVDEITTVVADIAASAQEQATALHEVNTAVNQMDQVTQQNAAMVEQTTTATHSLAQEMEGLARLTGRFTLAAVPPGTQKARQA